MAADEQCTDCPSLFCDSGAEVSCSVVVEALDGECCFGASHNECIWLWNVFERVGFIIVQGSARLVVAASGQHGRGANRYYR
jgi:hypothetical protein